MWLASLDMKQRSSANSMWVTKKFGVPVSTPFTQSAMLTRRWPAARGRGDILVKHQKRAAQKLSYPHPIMYFHQHGTSLFSRTGISWKRTMNTAYNCDDPLCILCSACFMCSRMNMGARCFCLDKTRIACPESCCVGCTNPKLWSIADQSKVDTTCHLSQSFCSSLAVSLAPPCVWE